MINKLVFHNFKGFHHVEIGLGRLTAIVGPNASGKTSILQGLDFLCESSQESLDVVFSGPHTGDHLCSRNAKGEMVISCEAGGVGVRLRYGPRKPAIWNQRSRPLEFESSVVFEAKDEYSGYPEWIEPSIESDFNYYLGPSRLLRFDASELSAPSYSKESHPRIDRRGNGLASVLAYLALNQPDTFSQVQARLREVVPIVERIRFERVMTSVVEEQVIRIDADGLTQKVRRDYVGEEIIFDLLGAPDIAAHLASEGTLIVLGLLTVLMGPDRPNLILLDDVDHGLHPRAQKDLVALLRRFLEETKSSNTQIVLTTHSPYFLDCLLPEEVRLTTLNDDGSASCASLVEHPDFDRWKDEMSPGEMWSLFGESWAANRGA
jgi:energy-coupling factor transporter ATP-binding protein EcfA2